MKIGELCHDHQKIETKMYENVHGSKNSKGSIKLSLYFHK